MKQKWITMGTAFLALIIMAGVVSADVPHLMRFQGKLTDKAGLPLNGSYNITFRIYNAASGGTMLWTETQSGVPAENGIFSALLGNVKALNLPFDAPYWLSMEVNNDGEMSPRQRISSVGYAYRAEVAESVAEGATVPQGAIILWSGTSCPEGYSRVAELDGRFIAGGPSYNPAAGGTNIHSHGAGTYTAPAHTHEVAEFGRSDDSGSQVSSGAFKEGWSYDHPYISDYTTSVNSPTVISGTSALADNRPEFATVIFCEKQ